MEGGIVADYVDPRQHKKYERETKNPEGGVEHVVDNLETLV